MAISNELIGARLPGTTFSWERDDTILYALGVGARPPRELDLLYETRGPVVLPTFALIANWWAMKDTRAAVDPGDAPMVHASQSLELLRPLEPEGTVRVDAEVVAIWDKGKSSIVEIEGVGTDDTGPLFRTRSSTMILGVGGWGGERGPSSSADRSTDEPDTVFEDEVRPEQAAIYRLSGDRNPLHIDPEAATRAGFPDVFLHGLCTLGFAARAVIASNTPADPRALKSISCRFSKPVMLGRPLTTRIWRGADGGVTFETTQDETIALSAGTAAFFDPAEI